MSHSEPMSRLDRDIARQKRVRAEIESRSRAIAVDTTAEDRAKAIADFMDQHRAKVTIAEAESDRLRRCLRVLRNALFPHAVVGPAPLRHLNPYEREKVLRDMFDRALAGERL